MPETVTIATRCRDCFYYRPYTLEEGGFCIHPDLHVEFLIDEIELPDRTYQLYLEDGTDAEAYAKVSENDFCSKGEPR